MKGTSLVSFVNRMKKRCRDEAAPILSIDDEELGALRNADCDDSVVNMMRQIPTFQPCKSGLYRSRGKMVPKLPITQKEIILQDPWTQTLARERFLLSDYSDDAGNRLIVFATDCVHHQLCTAMELSTPVHPYSPSSTLCTRMSMEQSSLLCLLSYPTRLKQLTGGSSQQWTIASLCWLLNPEWLTLKLQPWKRPFQPFQTQPSGDVSSTSRSVFGGKSRTVARRPNFGIMTVFINLCDELLSSLLCQVSELRMYGSRPWRTMMTTPLQSCVLRNMWRRHGSRDFLSSELKSLWPWRPKNHQRSGRIAPQVKQNV